MLVDHDHHAADAAVVPLVAVPLPLESSSPESSLVDHEHHGAVAAPLAVSPLHHVPSSPESSDAVPMTTNQSSWLWLVAHDHYDIVAVPLAVAPWALGWHVAVILSLPVPWTVQ